MALFEPVAALVRSAVGEGLGHDIALRLALEIVVTDRRRGAERLVDIAHVENAFLLSRPRPDARITIGL